MPLTIELPNLFTKKVSKPSWPCRSIFKRSRALVTTFLVLFALGEGLEGHGQELAARWVQLNDTLAGEEVVAFKSVNGRILKHGEYRFQASYQDTAYSEQHTSIEFSGRYVEGMKEGPWMFRQANVAPVGEARVSGFKLEQPVDGTELRIDGQYIGGKASGRWTAVRRTIKAGTIADTLKSISTNYVDGRPTGVVLGFDRNISFEGGFDNTGRVDGIWKFRTTSAAGKIIEHRVFDQGLLKAHFVELNGQRIDYTHPGLLIDEEAAAAQQWIELPVSSEVYEVMYGDRFVVIDHRQSKPLQSVMNEVTEVMRRTLFSFGRSNSSDVWALVGGCEPLKFPTIRVMELPFSDEERRLLDDGLRVARLCDEALKQFMNDPFTELGQQNYIEMALIRAQLTLMGKGVEQAEVLFRQLNHEAFKYLNRERLIELAFPRFETSQELRYSFRDTVRVGEYAGPQLSPTNRTLSSLTGFVNLAYDEILRQTQRANEIMEDYRRREALTAIELELYELRTTIDALFTNQADRDDFNDFHQAIAEGVLAFSQQTYHEYLALSMDERVEAGRQRVACLKALEGLYDEVRKQPYRIQNVKEQYTRTSWNPYTFTYMDETVKERLYRVYENELLPAVTDDLRNHLSCENVEAKARNYAQLYKRMLELRETDTRLLERQIKKSTSMATVVELFGFELNINGL